MVEHAARQSVGFSGQIPDQDSLEVERQKASGGGHQQYPVHGSLGGQGLCAGSDGHQHVGYLHGRIADEQDVFAAEILAGPPQANVCAPWSAVTQAVC